MSVRMEPVNLSALRKKRRPAGMTAFLVVWSGQLVSLVGSAMANFALSIYIWQLTGQATSFALLAFFGTLPNLIFAPFAGALVDRWNRKLTMMISDIAGLIVNGIMLALLITSHLEMWHLYALAVFNGIFMAFQWPAYSAAISTMLEKKHFARASALLSVADSASGIMAPVVAAILIVTIGIPGIILLDAISFVLAIITLLAVAIPQPPRTELSRKASGNLFQEAGFGFRYIFRNRSLLGLQLTFFFGNLLASFGFVVSIPMILARSGNNATVLGTVESVAGVGGVLGGILISIWGGPKRRIMGVIGGWFLTFAGMALLGFSQGPLLWAVAMFCVSFFLPLVNSSNQAIWQAKIPPEIQGKVFSVRRLIAQMASPLSMLLAGPLADSFFGPAMLSGGFLSGVFGPFLGVGPGAGMSLMILLMGLIGGAVAFITYSIPSIRNVETIVPDFVLPATSETTDTAVPPPIPVVATVTSRSEAPASALPSEPPQREIISSHEAASPDPSSSDPEPMMKEANQLASRGQTKEAMGLLRRVLATPKADPGLRQVAARKLASLLYLAGKDGLADAILLHYRSRPQDHDPK
jgi:DHA3 family macrolide efflux protein-like MFS transporter